MPDQITLDVIDRPAAGVLGASRRLRDLRQARPEGIRAVLQTGTARFVPRVRPSMTLRRIGVLTVWDGEADVEEQWEQQVAPLADGSREHWHVRAEVVRASFSAPWGSWTPDVTDARPLDEAEPALILISGELHARYVPAFFRDGARAVAHAFEQPGYLGGLAISSSPLNTTSCSAWRRYADAKEYAFRPGGHSDAMRRDRARGHHRTEHFVRLRPLAERGSLQGVSPFAEVLSSRPVAAG